MHNQIKKFKKSLPTTTIQYNTIDVIGEHEKVINCRESSPTYDASDANLRHATCNRVDLVRAHIILSTAHAPPKFPRITKKYLKPAIGAYLKYHLERVNRLFQAQCNEDIDFLRNRIVFHWLLYGNKIDAGRQAINIMYGTSSE